ncbi:MAG: nuclear transport factor 2 family protein [Sneathiella sp.]|nr:nuclear transport factor 2 family protein [Sneathiella sp.]
MQHEEKLLKEFIDDLINNPSDCRITALTDDCEIHVCLGNQLFTDSYSATFIGKNGARNFVKSWRDFLKDTQLTFQEFVSERGKVIARGDFSCRLTISGNPWSANWMQICTFKKDQIQKIRVFSDFRPSSAESIKVRERSFQQQAEASLAPFIRN